MDVFHAILKIPYYILFKSRWRNLSFIIKATQRKLIRYVFLSFYHEHEKLIFQYTVLNPAC